MISDRGKGWILTVATGALVWGSIYLALGWEWVLAMMILGVAFASYLVYKQ